MFAALGGGTNGPGGPTAATLTTQNGTITEGSSLNTNSPYVLLTGRIASNTGTAARFAGYDTGTGEVVAATTTAWAETNVSAATSAAGLNLVYRNSGNVTPTLGADQVPQSLVIEPNQGALALDLTGRTLTTSGLALSLARVSGALTFTLQGGTLAGPGAADRNVFVPTTTTNTLFVTSNFAGSTGDVVKAGAGLLALTGATDQFDFGPSAVTALVINSGAVRVRQGTNFGPNNIVRLRGGTLELDTAAGAVTFSRTLGNSAGQINWVAPLAGNPLADRGSGGFAAFGGNPLTVNIGGDNRQLVWGGTTGGNQFFVRDTNALYFGNSRSTNLMTLTNPLALDDGSAGLPAGTRQVFVQSNTATGVGGPNAPANRTIFSGVVSGSAATQLVKSGLGNLELTAANTYAGGTVVDVGVLTVSNTSGSATGTGRVVVNDTLTGSGTIAPAAGNPVVIGRRAYLFTDAQYQVSAGRLTLGSDGVNTPVRFQTESYLVSQLRGTAFNEGTGTYQYGRLVVRGTGTITIDPLALLATGGVGGFVPANGDRYGLLDNRTGSPIGGVFANTTSGFVAVNDNSGTQIGQFQVTYTGDIQPDGTVLLSGGNDLVVFNYSPVPEPGLLVAVAAAGLVAARRRRGG